MDRKQLFSNLLFFFLAIITLISASFAWFNLTKVGEIGGIQSNVESLMGMLHLEVKRGSDDEFHIIKEHNEMIELFDLTKPGDTYTFRIRFTNDSSKDRAITASIINIQSIPYSEYDSLDVFYLNNITIINDGVDISDQNNITPNSSDPVIKHGQLLNYYRLNNLIDTYNNIRLFTPINVLPGNEAVITFTIVYDETTENINYSYNSLYFDSIFVKGY